MCLQAPRLPLSLFPQIFFNFQCLILELFHIYRKVETVQNLSIVLTQFPLMLKSAVTMIHLSKLGKWTQVYTVVKWQPLLSAGFPITGPSCSNVLSRVQFSITWLLSSLVLTVLQSFFVFMTLTSLNALTPCGPGKHLPVFASK